jgi:hypothetical protein
VETQPRTSTRDMTCVPTELSSGRMLNPKLGWCAREDSNLHPLRDQILSLARLPFRHARAVVAQQLVSSWIRLF